MGPDAIATVSAAVVMLLGTVYTTRSSRAQARDERREAAQADAVDAHFRSEDAETRQRAADLETYREHMSQLRADVEQLRTQNSHQAERQSRLEALVRAFARSADRWCGQMRRAGIDPEPPEPMVEEYYQSGV